MPAASSKCAQASPTSFIDPGSPWQNGHIESFNSRLREECRNGHVIESLLEAQTSGFLSVGWLLTDWLTQFNLHRSQSFIESARPALLKGLKAVR